MDILKDIKGVILNPGECFDEIRKRNLILPSFLIYLIAQALFLILPFPLAGEGFITKIPILVSIPLAFFIYTGIIHLISSRYSLNGSYRTILSVWGYPCIPYFLSLLAFPFLYLGIYINPIFYLLACIVFIIILIWNIILCIIAIRIVYKIILKRVLIILFIFLCLGSILESIFVSFNETLFFQTYIDSKITGGERFIAWTKDKVSYSFRSPRIGELVIFVKKEDAKKVSFPLCLSIVGQGAPLYSWVIGKKEEYIGRIKEKRGDDFLVLPEGKIEYGYPYGFIKKEQIKGRVCGVIKLEEYQKEGK